MDFPSELLTNNRQPVDNSLIHNSCQLFIRHHPDQNWDNEKDIPNYAQISLWSGQSCNVSLFSLPVWVRFNDNREYKRNNAVVSYDVEYVRNPSLMIAKMDSIFHKNFPDTEELTKQVVQLAGKLEPVHDPLDNNYSHCEIIGEKPSKSVRQVLRFLLKYCAEAVLKPNEEPTIETIETWRSKMNALQESKNITF